MNCLCCFLFRVVFGFRFFVPLYVIRLSRQNLTTEAHFFQNRQQRYNNFSRYATNSIFFSFNMVIFFLQPNDFFFPPLIRCSLRSRLCLCSAKFLYKMGSAYRLHRRTCYTKKEPPRRISEVLKVAATSSPTIFRSAVPSAMLSLCPVLSLLPAPLSAPLSPAPLRAAVARLCPLRSLSRARALARAPQARTAHTPHGSLRAHTAARPAPHR